MRKTQDLTNIINNNPTGKRLSKALAYNWNWQKHERDEATAKNNIQKQFFKETRAEKYEVIFDYFGD